MEHKKFRKVSLLTWRILYKELRIQELKWICEERRIRDQRQMYIYLQSHYVEEKFEIGASTYTVI